MGPGIQNDRAFRLVKPELIILCGVVTVKGDVECGVEADAETQLLTAGIFHGQGMTNRSVFQPECATQNKIKGELRRLKLRAGTQLQDDFVLIRPYQRVLHIPGKALLDHMVGLAFVRVGAAGQFPGPRKKDGCVTGPDLRVSLP